MQHSFRLGDVEHAVALSRATHGYRIHFGGQAIPVQIETGGGHRARLTIGDRHYDVLLATHGDDVFVQLDGEAWALRHLDPLAQLAAAAGGAAADEIRAPMPGSIIAVAVKAGDVVTRGQTLLVMESMKMETTITAPRDGVIATVAYEKGQTFERDALLLGFAPTGDAA